MRRRRAKVALFGDLTALACVPTRAAQGSGIARSPPRKLINRSGTHPSPGRGRKSMINSGSGSVRPRQLRFGVDHQVRHPSGAGKGPKVRDQQRLSRGGSGGRGAAQARGDVGLGAVGPRGAGVCRWRVGAVDCTLSSHIRPWRLESDCTACSRSRPGKSCGGFGTKVALLGPWGRENPVDWCRPGSGGAVPWLRFDPRGGCCQSAFLTNSSSRSISTLSATTALPAPNAASKDTP